MIHFFENIHGWFDFDDIYSEVVKNAQNGAHFVEVGTWLGRSAAYMIVEIVNSHKNIKFDTVDNWLGSKEQPWPYEEVLSQCENHCAYDLFIKKMGPNVKYINNIHRMDSTEAANLYQDKSLDFVFIDACHTTDCVTTDLKAWFPKVKLKGVLAGHDYTLPGVKKAVDTILGNAKITTTKNSWRHVKTINSLRYYL